MTSVMIGIATYKRPEGLTRILRSIEDLDCVDELTVLVVDNCSEETIGRDSALRLQATYKHKLITVVEPLRGISNVRNTMIKTFMENDGYDYLAMIDDDQEVNIDWMTRLIETAQQYNADVVGSSVQARFDSVPPAWVLELDLFSRKSRKSGVVDIIHGTGGVLISKDVFRRLGVQYFDETFGLTGGGDKEFFYRLGKKGARFVFDSDAVCYEYYNADRLTHDWAQRRAERIGNAEARLKLKNGDNLIPLFFTNLVKFFGGVFLYIIFYFDSRKRFKLRLSLLHKVGVFKGVFGLTKNVY